MKLQHKYKVALVGYRLGIGGAERVMANLSLYLDSIGVQVHIITVVDAYGYEFKGEVFSTEVLKKGNQGILGRVRRFVGLYRFFRTHQFDYIIDFRFRLKSLEEYVITHLLYNAPSIFTVHSSKTEAYIPKNILWAKMIYSKAKAIVAITQKSKQVVQDTYGFSNVYLIANGIDMDLIDQLKHHPIDLQYQYIIGVGQMQTTIKQFDHLIRAYSTSTSRKKHIHLVLCGAGQLTKELQELSIELGVQDFVHFIGFQQNAFKYMAKAKFLVLSSAFEGFSMVLVEALACGVPVVAYDCEFGPAEIIKEGENGLLIENQDIKALAHGINTMLGDALLYARCTAQAKASVVRFDVKNIGKQWVELMSLT